MAHEYTLNTPRLFLNLEPKCLWLVFERLTTWQPECLPQRVSILGANTSLSVRKLDFCLWGLTRWMDQRVTDLWHAIGVKASKHAQHGWHMTAELWHRVWDEEANCHLVDLSKICLIQLWGCAIFNLFLYSTQGKVVFVSMFDQQVNTSICPSAFDSCYCGVLGLSLCVCSHKITSLLSHSWVIVILCNVMQRLGSLNRVSTKHLRDHICLHAAKLFFSSHRCCSIFTF